jgi:4-hydroxybenzoate polyprenyl transferase
MEVHRRIINCMSRYNNKSSIIRRFMMTSIDDDDDDDKKKKELYAHEMDTWADRNCHKAILPFVKLARADRPIGTWLLLWPCLWSQIMATSQPLHPADPLLCAKFALGAYVMRGAGCVVNDMLDRDIDKKVARTRLRPLAAGTVTMPQATAFLGTQLGIGLAVLTSMNDYTIALASSSLILVGIYPLAKRFVNCPQAVLGLTFNWGALVGWAAVRGEITFSDVPTVFLLYGGCFFWTMMYDTLYAHQDKKDDVKVGVKSSALWLGDVNAKRWLGGFGALSAVCWSLSGLTLDASWPYYAGVAGTACHMAWQIQTADLNSPQNLGKRFKSNAVVGAIMFSGICADRLVFCC